MPDRSHPGRSRRLPALGRCVGRGRERLLVCRIREILGVIETTPSADEGG
jgi:hypothetical protein